MILNILNVKALYLGEPEIYNKHHFRDIKIETEGGELLEITLSGKDEKTLESKKIEDLPLFRFP